MPVKATERMTRSWEVDVKRETTTRLSAASSNGDGKTIVVTVGDSDDDGGDISREVTADEFAEWATKVLNNLHVDGWQLKRPNGARPRRERTA